MGRYEVLHRKAKAGVLTKICCSAATGARASVCVHHPPQALSHVKLLWTFSCEQHIHLSESNTPFSFCVTGWMSTRLKAWQSMTYVKTQICSRLLPAGLRYVPDFSNASLAACQPKAIVRFMHILCKRQVGEPWIQDVFRWTSCMQSATRKIELQVFSTWDCTCEDFWSAALSLNSREISRSLLSIVRLAKSWYVSNSPCITNLWPL